MKASGLYLKLFFLPERKQIRVYYIPNRINTNRGNNCFEFLEHTFLLCILGTHILFFVFLGHILCFVFLEDTFFVFILGTYISVLYSWNTHSLFWIIGTPVLCFVFLELTFFVLYSWNAHSLFCILGTHILRCVFLENTFFVLYTWNTHSLFCILGTQVLCFVFLENTFFVLYSWNIHSLKSSGLFLIYIGECFSMATGYKTLIYYSFLCYSCIVCCFVLCFILFCSVLFSPDECREYKPVCLYVSFQTIWVLCPVYVRLCCQSTKFVCSSYTIEVYANVPEQLIC